MCVWPTRLRSEHNCLPEPGALPASSDLGQAPCFRRGAAAVTGTLRAASLPAVQMTGRIRLAPLFLASQIIMEHQGNCSSHSLRPTGRHGGAELCESKRKLHRAGCTLCDKPYGAP